MNKIVYARFLFSIGSIVVYQTRPKYYFFGPASYFWKYMDVAEFSGPFMSIMQTMEHCMKSQNLPPTRPIANNAIIQLTNVINVDFKKRKRIK